MKVEKKYVQKWKNKVAIKKAIEEFSGSGSRIMRTLAGNYLGVIRNNPYAKPGTRSRKDVMRNHLMSITRWLRSKSINTPTLYKGLSKQNANQFRKTGKFTTRTPTSTSKNRFQAQMFTNNNNPILLVIPPGKHNAMILGNHGIKARQPREQEVILTPGTFIPIGRNRKTGNYIVTFENRGRSVPRRRNFII